MTGKPYQHPQVRKKLPNPFARPSITVGGETAKQVKRTWQDLSVTEIKKDDTVAGFGTVAAAVESIEIDQVYEDGGWDEGGEDILVDRPVWWVRLYNIMGEYQDYAGEARLFVFAPERQ